MKEKEIEDELVSIRSMMERSSKFISLSGLSGILAGVYALIGALVAYYIIYDRVTDTIVSHIRDNPAKFRSYGSVWVKSGDHYYTELSIALAIIALVVLIASIGTGVFLSIRKAKRKGQPMWSNASRLLLFNMAVPLLSGGALVLVHLFRGHYGLIAPSCLVFYGLSLVAAGNYTFTMVKYLGLCEIILGLIAACLPGYGLLFWAIGFGVLHIIYGSMMYFKYDR